MYKSIVLTGGGTAGHIMPNIALINKLKKYFENIYYIGTNGLEKEICKNNNIKFYEITATKFVRKLSLKTVLIPFKLLKSINMSKKILKELKPDIIFSKGGYVSIPTCIAGKKLKIPVVTHESDLSIGLANKVILKYANKLITSFKETKPINKKCIYIGSPIRESIFLGNKNNVINKFNYDNKKPTILFMGGSLGAKAINEIIYKNLKTLTNKYNILHLSGKDNKVLKHDNYYKVDFTNNIEDFFALSDVVVCRSGANTIFELAALKKPMILIPLPKGNSRGDQVENAVNFKNNNFANIIMQENLTINNLINEINNTIKNKNNLINNLSKLNLKESNNKIIKIILNEIKK